MILAEGGVWAEPWEQRWKEGCQCDIFWASELQREQVDWQMSPVKHTEIRTFMSIYCTVSTDLQFK